MKKLSKSGLNKPDTKPPPEPGYACVTCGKIWNTRTINTGICECGQKYETSGWPNFKIKWLTNDMEKTSGSGKG